MRLLNIGGFGEVYAQGSEAVKVVKCPSATEAEEVETEFMCMKWLDPRCPNICSARKLEVKDGKASIWMELCEGDFGEVVAVTHSVPHPVAEVELLGLRFLEQTARALKVLHAAGMVHADLKDNSVLVSKFPESMRAGFALGTLKLSDFGQAYQESQRRRLRRPQGTPGFMSPEMATLSSDDWLCCLAQGTPSDMYSLGLVYGTS